MAKGFVKNIKAEMKKVVWPTKKQILNNTGLVIGLVIVLAAIVLSKLFRYTFLEFCS